MRVVKLLKMGATKVFAESKKFDFETGVEYPLITEELSEDNINRMVASADATIATQTELKKNFVQLLADMNKALAKTATATTK